MNKLNLNQTGGFPLSTNILDAMQTAYGIFNSLGEIAGNFAIISGCVVSGSNVTNGVVYINGEVLEFRGGGLGTNVIIKEETESRVFEDGSTKNVIYKRYATFGSSTPDQTFPWANFKRVDNLIEQGKKNIDFENRLKKLEEKPSPIPIGLIAVWGKPETEPIPDGWKECTDFRGRMPVGWDPDYQYDDEFDFGLNGVGNSGGSLTVQLAEKHLPAHNHSTAPFNKFAGRGSEIGNTHASPPGGDYTNLSTEYGLYNMTDTDWNTATEKTIGSDFPHNNMPPYRVIRFIEFVGFN